MRNRWGTECGLEPESSRPGLVWAPARYIYNADRLQQRMTKSDIRKFLALAVECEERSDLPQAADYLKLAILQAEQARDEDFVQVIGYRLSAFFRRLGENEQANHIEAKANQILSSEKRPARVIQLEMARNTIESLKRQGEISDESDALDKLSSRAWLISHGCAPIADLLMSETGRSAVQAVFQETGTFSSI